MAPKPKPDDEPLSLFPIHTLWTLELNSLLSAPPAFDGLHAFFPLEGDRIVAYDLTAGDQLWIVPIGTTSKPAASADLLFVAGTDKIEALHVADGSPAWRAPLPSPLAAPLVWDNGWLVAATTDGAVLALRAADGELLWRSAVGSPAHASPSLAANRVYVPTEDGRVVALQLEQGDQAWVYRLGGAASEVLALGDRLYVGSKDNFFYCLKASDAGAEQMWRWPAGGDVVGMPIVDEHRVFFVSLANLVWALDRGGGNMRWRRALTSRPTSGPAKAGTLLIVTGLGRSLPTFKMLDGSPVGDVPATGDVAAPPHVIEIPAIFGPVVISVSKDMANGVTVTANARQIELDAPLSVAPLPNPLTPDGTPLPTTIPKQ